MNELKNSFTIQPDLKLTAFTEHQLQISFNDTVILKIEKIDFPDHFEIHFIFPLANDLVSPDHSLLPLILHHNDSLLDQNSELIDLNHIILKFNSFYLNISKRPDFEWDIRSIDYIEKKLIVVLNQPDIYSFDIKLFHQLSDFIIDQARIKRIVNLPALFADIGLIFDINEGKDTLFSTFKEKLDRFHFYTILNNNQKNNVFHFNSHPKVQNELCLMKLKLNHIQFIVQYAHQIPSQPEFQELLIKKRDGQTISYNGMGYLDFHNQNGQNKLLQLYDQAANQGATGLYLDPAFYCFNSREEYEKAVCKVDHKFYPYQKYFNQSLKRLNSINSQCKTQKLIFLSNCQKTNLPTAIFIKKINPDTPHLFQLILQIYYQALQIFGIHITYPKKTVENNQKLVHLFSLLIFMPIIMIDQRLFHQLIKPGIINILFNSLNLRQQLKLIIYHLEQSHSFYFLPQFNKNKKASGYYLGSQIFISILNETILNKTFSVPPGNWYCLQTEQTIIGNRIINIDQDEHKYLCLIKENSCLPVSEEKFYHNPNFPQKIKFFLYFNQNRQFEIREKIVINDYEKIICHLFSIQFKLNKMVIHYQADEDINLNRIFIFQAILDGKKIDCVIYNKKPAFIPQKERKNQTEFTIKNYSNSIQFEIYFSPFENS